MPEILSKGKMKKMARNAALQADRARTAKQRAAARKPDLLEEYSAFRRYQRQGIDVVLEGKPGSSLDERSIEACIALQGANATAETPFDATAARDALLHPESRVLLMCARSERGEGEEEEEEEGEDSEWDLVPEAAALMRGRDAEPSPPRSSGSIVGFIHLQFCVADGPPLLCVLNVRSLPLGPRARERVQQRRWRVRSPPAHAHAR
jgi:hypothetical protein